MAEVRLEGMAMRLLRRFGGHAAVLLCAVSLANCATADRDHAAAVQYEAIPLNPANPEQYEIGRLHYLGGLHLHDRDRWFGGHSGMRWHRGRLVTVMDNGRWSSFEPVERDGRLEGIRNVRAGDLHDEGGTPLGGKLAGDAEALTRDRDGHWLVAFEQDHRVMKYTSLKAKALPTGIRPHSLHGALASNNGIEAMVATGTGFMLCAERIPQPAPNCHFLKGNQSTPFAMTAPPPLERLGGVPTDADVTRDGVIYLLFRSYSPADGPGAAIAALKPDGTSAVVATFRPPVSVDNMEGIAVREVSGRTYIYLISDDNFSPAQRTLLMKFEVSADQDMPGEPPS